MYLGVWALQWPCEVQTKHHNLKENVVLNEVIWLFQKRLLSWDFHTQLSLVFAESGPKKRKYPVSFSSLGHTIKLSLNAQHVKSELMGYNSKRPQQVSFLWAKNMELRLQLTLAEQKLDKRLKQCFLVWWVCFCCNIWIAGSEFGVQKEFKLPVVDIFCIFLWVP